MPQAEAALGVVAAVIVAVGVSQAAATQLTHAAFRSVPQLSPLWAVWLGMHWNFLLAIPAVRAMLRARCSQAGGGDDRYRTGCPEVGKPASARSVDSPKEPTPSPVAPALSAVGGDEFPVVDLTDDQDGEPCNSGSAAVVRLPRSPAGWLTLVAVLLGFYFAYAAANVSYTAALAHTSPALVAAIFSSAPAFVCALSWLVLGKPVQVTDIAAVTLAVGGVLLIVHPWTVSIQNAEYSAAAALAPVAAAAYKVFFAKRFADVGPAVVGLTLASLALINIVVGTSALAVTAAVADDRSMIAPPTIPWGWLVASGVAALGFNFSVNYGVTIMHPLFVSLGTVLATVLNVLIDAVASRRWPSPVEGAGIACSVASLFVLIGALWRDRHRWRPRPATSRADLLDAA